jgi:predicted ATPase
MRPHFLALLAEACPPTGQKDQGLQILDEALALVESTGERMYGAELCRLRGERLLRGARDSADVAAAEACFEQSLAMARQQEALSLELRAAMSLARLRCDRARHVPVRDMILPIYERFEDGFATVDLREARALLDRRADR